MFLAQAFIGSILESIRNFNILILFKSCQSFPDKISNIKHGKSETLLFP